MLDPNQASINFEQVTGTVPEIQQTHKEVLSGMESYRIQHKMLGYAFSDRHSQLESLKQQLEKPACRRAVRGWAGRPACHCCSLRAAGRLNEQLTESSARLSKFRKACPTTGGSSLWQRYWTAMVVGVMSALLTNLVWIWWVEEKEEEEEKGAEIVIYVSSSKRIA
jgi:hypothetical protein